MTRNDKLAEEIRKLTEVVVRMTPPIPAIAPIPSIPAIPAIAVSGDHDLLIKLDEKLIGVGKKVDELGIKLDTRYTTIEEHADVVKIQVDHEKRIRDVEEQKTPNETVKKLVYGMVSFILLAVLSAIVYLVVKK